MGENYTGVCVDCTHNMQELKHGPQEKSHSRCKGYGRIRLSRFLDYGRERPCRLWLFVFVSVKTTITEDRVRTFAIVC